MTLDHKTSDKGQLSEIEIYASPESFKKIGVPWMHGLLGKDNIWLRYNYLIIWNLRVKKNLNIEKTTFKVVQMKVLALHIKSLPGVYL